MIHGIRPYPTLLSFLAFFGGIVAAGMIGAVHAAVLTSMVVVLAYALTRARGLIVPGAFWALTLACMLGALRLGAERGSGGFEASPGGFPDAEFRYGPGTFLVEVSRIIRRDPVSTMAVASIRRIRPSADGKPSGRVPAIVYVRGLAELIDGGSFVVKGRARPPARPSDSISPGLKRRDRRVGLIARSPAAVFRAKWPSASEPGVFDAWRLSISRRIADSLQGDASCFAHAVLLGEGGAVDPSLRADLSSLGTAHVLAVSGLHVASVALIAAFVITFVAGPLVATFVPSGSIAGLRLAAAALAGACMAAMAGMTPSAQRAAAMVSLGAAGAMTGRRQGLEGLAGMAGLLSLVLDPEDAFSMSFVLSYSAVLGMAALTGPIAFELRRAVRFGRASTFDGEPGRFVTALSCSLAASISTMPATLLAFGTVGLPGPLVNMVVLPLMGLVVMPVALVFLLIAAITPNIPGWVTVPVQSCFDLFLAGQRALAELAPSGETLASGLPLCLFLAAVCALVGYLTSRRVSACAPGAATGLALAIALGPHVRAQAGDELVVSFMDAGKGDAILVRCPGGQSYLVDTAGREWVDGKRGIARRLVRAGITRLEGVVVTHGDEDHSGGLEKIANRIDVGEVVAPCQEAVREPLAGMMRRLAEKGVKTRCVNARMTAMPECAARSLVLWPPAFRDLESNSASLVVRLSWSGRSLLLTGDIGSQQEAEMVSTGIDLRSTVLKLAHHGSSRSSSIPFLRAVRPEVSVVSGWAEAKTERPGSDVLDRLALVGVPTLSSAAMDGVTVIIGDGKYQIKPGSL